MLQMCGSYEDIHILRLNPMVWFHSIHVEEQKIKHKHPNDEITTKE